MTGYDDEVQFGIPNHALLYVTVCHHISDGLYSCLSAQRLSERSV